MCDEGRGPRAGVRAQWVTRVRGQHVTQVSSVCDGDLIKLVVWAGWGLGPHPPLLGSWWGVSRRVLRCVLMAMLLPSA